MSRDRQRRRWVLRYINESEAMWLIYIPLFQSHAEEIDHLKKTSQQLKSQLEGILHKK